MISINTNMQYFTSADMSFVTIALFIIFSWWMIHHLTAAEQLSTTTVDLTKRASTVETTQGHLSIDNIGTTYISVRFHDYSDMQRPATTILTRPL